MKPFNLQEALAGKSVQTRDGRPVKIAGYNQEAKFCKLIGWINNEIVCSWDDNGNYSSYTASTNDLFMIPEKREVWVCYWRHGNYTGVSHAYTEQAVKEICHAHMHDIITTVKIWEEEI